MLSESTQSINVLTIISVIEVQDELSGIKN